MKTLRVALALLTLGMVAGCAVVPAGPGYYSGPPGYYEPAPAYYGPPIYYGPPAYYGPSVSIGIFGGWGGQRRWH